MFIVLLTSLIHASIIVNVSNHTKCVSLRNEKWEIQPTLINLHPNKYSHKLCCYPFEVKLDRCIVRCKTPNDWSNKVYVLNKIYTCF